MQLIDLAQQKEFVMKVFFQVFGFTCAVVLAVFLGNVAFTKYQLYEAQVVLTKMADSFESLPQPKVPSDNQNLRIIIDQLSKSNRKLSDDLIAAQRELKVYKAVKSAKQKAFAKYHTDSEDCLIFEGDAHMVECQNVKMRAKKEFERLWQSGQRSF